MVSYIISAVYRTVEHIWGRQAGTVLYNVVWLGMVWYSVVIPHQWWATIPQGYSEVIHISRRLVTHTGQASRVRIHLFSLRKVQHIVLSHMTYVTEVGSASLRMGQAWVRHISSWNRQLAVTNSVTCSSHIVMHLILTPRVHFILLYTLCIACPFIWIDFSFVDQQQSVTKVVLKKYLVCRFMSFLSYYFI